MIGQSACERVKETKTVMQPSAQRSSFAQLLAAEGGLSWFLSPEQVVYITTDPSLGHISLDVTNNTGKSITFSPDSRVRIAFKGLLEQKVIAGIDLDDGEWGSDDWAFTSPPRHTAKDDYVEVCAKKKISVENNHSAEIHLRGIVGSPPSYPYKVRITYSKVGQEGTFLDGEQFLQVFRLPPGARGDLHCSFADRQEYYNNSSSIYVSTREDKISNRLILKVGRNNREKIVLKDGQQPRIFISFIGGNSQSAVATNEDLKEVDIHLDPDPAYPGERWQIDKDKQAISPVWTLKPAGGTKVLFQAGFTSFRISNLFTERPVGSTLMYIQYVDLPEFGWTAMDLTKTDPVPYIHSFDAYDEKRTPLEVAASVDLKQPITLRWDIFAARGCLLIGKGKFSANGSIVVYPEASTNDYTIQTVPPHAQQTVELKVRPPEVSISVTFGTVFEVQGQSWFSCVVKWETRSAAHCEVIDGGPKFTEGRVPSSLLSTDLNGTLSFEARDFGFPVLVKKNRFSIRANGLSEVSKGAPDSDVWLDKRRRMG